MLVHHHLLALGCGSGSPTLSPLQSSLQMQAARFDGASNSPRLGRRGRGAYLPDRLAAHHPASAQIGLPAEPSPSYEGFLTQRNQDTSAGVSPSRDTAAFDFPLWIVNFESDICRGRRDSL